MGKNENECFGIMYNGKSITVLWWKCVPGIRFWRWLWFSPCPCEHIGPNQGCCFQLFPGDSQSDLVLPWIPKPSSVLLAVACCSGPFHPYHKTKTVQPSFSALYSLLSRSDPDVCYHHRSVLLPRYCTAYSSAICIMSPPLTYLQNGGKFCNFC